MLLQFVQNISQILVQTDLGYIDFRQIGFTIALTQFSKEVLEMALVANGFSLSVKLVDNGNNQTVKTYDLQGANLTEATANANDVLDALANVTDAVIKGYDIASKFTNDAFAYPSSGVQIEDLAQITLGITDDITKSATITIPAPKSGVFVGTSGEAANKVRSTTPVAEYWALFQAGNQAYLSDGETADVFIGGKRIHRGSRRG